MSHLTLYNLSLWLHISGAIVGFGSIFAHAVIFPVAMKGDKRNLPFVHKLDVSINRRLANPGLTLVVVTGIFQVVRGNWRFTTPWIAGGIAIAVILGGLMGSYFIPEDRRLLHLVERDIAASDGAEIVLSAEYQRRARVMGVITLAAGFLVVVAVFLMVTKPGS